MRLLRALAGKMVRVDPFRVTIAGKETYGCVNMADFLDALREALKPNPIVIENFRRMYVPLSAPPRDGPEAPVKTAVLYHEVQVGLGTPQMAVVD
jgi:pyruvate decarboxylase